MYEIQEQAAYPEGMRQYIPVHPDDVQATAKALIDHIATLYGRIPVHYKNQSVGAGQNVALIWSGDTRIHFGISESRQVPKYVPLILSVDMSEYQNAPMIGSVGWVQVTSGQAMIATPIEVLAEVLPTMYARRDQLIAAREAILWSGYDKQRPGSDNDSLGEGPR